MRVKSLAFFGALAASVSHELNNVLAIINEHSGLIDDVAEAARHGVAPDPDKLKRISAKISRQIERGKDLIKRLNRFAHSADREVTSFDLNSLLDDIANLTQRIAGLKGIQIVFKPAAAPIAIESNPFCLQQAVFVCFRLFLSASDKNRLVTISAACPPARPGAREAVAGPIIRLSGAALPERSSERETYEYLEMLLEEINGDLQFVSSEIDGQSILIRLSSASGGAGNFSHEGASNGQG